jgi:hypothetical protein
MTQPQGCVVTQHMVHLPMTTSEGVAYRIASRKGRQCNEQCRSRALLGHLRLPCATAVVVPTFAPPVGETCLNVLRVRAHAVIRQCLTTECQKCVQGVISLPGFRIPSSCITQSSRKWRPHAARGCASADPDRCWARDKASCPAEKY